MAGVIERGDVDNFDIKQYQRMVLAATARRTCPSLAGRGCVVCRCTLVDRSDMQKHMLMEVRLSMVACKCTRANILGNSAMGLATCGT